MTAIQARALIAHHIKKRQFGRQRRRKPKMPNGVQSAGVILHLPGLEATAATAK